MNKHVQKNILRVTFDAMLLAMSILAPWWAAFSFTIFLILFKKSFEAVLAGVILDTIYSNNANGAFFGDFFYTSILLILTTLSFLTMRYIRK
jgi:hypothetical protein